MSKSPSKKDKKLKSQYSTSQYVRPPIHRNAEENEEETEDDTEELDSNTHHQTNLYPNIKEELRSIKQRKLDAKENKKKNNILDQSNTFGKPKYETNSSSTFKYVLFLLLVVVAILGFFHTFSINFFSVKKPEIDVAEIVTDMQNHFKEQQSITFFKLKSALTKIVNEKPEPRAPAIFTIIANKGAENTASDFSIYLAKTIAPEHYVSINESSHWHKNPNDLKYKIDSEIKSKLEKEIFNVVIVDRFHIMPFDAATIFHSFCDHGTAPYKRAVYLFIVHLSRSIPENSTLKYIDEVAMNSLRNYWHTSTNDQVDSLIARVTVNVVNIR